MKYNEQTRLVTADENMVIEISEGIYVKSLFLANELTIENIKEINKSEIINLTQYKNEKIN